MNDSCNYERYSRMTTLNFEWDSIISRTCMSWNGKILDLHLESSRQDPKVSGIQTLQHSRNDPSNGTHAWKKQGKQLRKIRGSYSENQHEFFKPSPESNVSSPPMRTSKERELVHSGLTGFTSHTMSRSDVTPEEPQTFQMSTDPSVIMTAMVRLIRQKKKQYIYIYLWFGHVCSRSIIQRITRVLSLGNLCE